MTYRVYEIPDGEDNTSKMSSWGVKYKIQTKDYEAFVEKLEREIEIMKSQLRAARAAESAAESAEAYKKPDEGGGRRRSSKRGAKTVRRRRSRLRQKTLHRRRRPF